MTSREKILFSLLGGVALLYLLARSDKGAALVSDVLTSGSRGIRNNNPGNIRKSATVWAGQAPIERQIDQAFVVFSSPEYGIRAMTKILRSYMARGLNTVERIISTWAPPIENNTAAYIAAVSSETGLAPNVQLTTLDIVRLIPAIIRHENGSQPYSRSIIERGVAMSG